MWCRCVKLTFIVRSYLAESTGSHPNSEVKQLWACTVLRWGTTRESQVTHVLVVCRCLGGRDLPQGSNPNVKSGVAQRKRVGLITQRSEDRNLPPLLLAVLGFLAEWSKALDSSSSLHL